MKEYRISARVPEELKKRLEAAEKKLGIDQAIIVRKCVEALVEYVEEHGEITFPLAMSPKSKRAAAEIKYTQRPRPIILNETKALPKKRPGENEAS